MQLIQFVIGTSISAYIWFTLNHCFTFGQRICAGYFLAYTAYLMVLFARFYFKSYCDKTENHALSNAKLNFNSSAKKCDTKTH